MYCTSSSQSIVLRRLTRLFYASQGAPEKGINALDAAVQGYVNVSTLRQQLPTTTRVHGIIGGGEHWAPNGELFNFERRARTATAR